jgi:hypothetical protein
MEYTPDQVQSLYLAKRRHDHAGRPETAALIDHLMGLEAPYGEIWKIAQADVEAMVKPEKVTDIVPPPPFTGRGSTVAAWRKFAMKVSDMEEEVITSMGRNDLITVLVDRGIIEGPEGGLLGVSKSG